MKTDCFAFTTVHGRPACRALTECICENDECGFFKSLETHLIEAKKYDEWAKAFCLSKGITRKPLSLKDDARLRTLQARTKLEDVRDCPADSRRGYCRLHGHGFICEFKDGSCLKEHC